MMQVILVRHAETEWNVKGIIQGHSDSALTLRGERQTAALLAAFVASDYRVECVYASPLGRAWQMGQRLAESFHCSLIAEPALKEQAFGQFEGMTTIEPCRIIQTPQKRYSTLMQSIVRQRVSLSHMLRSELCIF